MRKCKLSLVVLLGMLLLSGPAWAFKINVNGGDTDVGGLDTIYAEGTFIPSAANELNFVQTALDTTDFYISETYDVYSNDWVQTIESTNIYALELKGEPSYFLIKLGTGGTDIPESHFLYTNLPSLLYAVVDVSAWGGATGSINIGRVSHIGEIYGVPVPEPSAMLLLGLGLVGIAGLGRNKLIKK